MNFLLMNLSYHLLFGNNLRNNLWSINFVWHDEIGVIYQQRTKNLESYLKINAYKLFGIKSWLELTRGQLNSITFYFLNTESDVYKTAWFLVWHLTSMVPTTRILVTQRINSWPIRTNRNPGSELILTCCLLMMLI